MLSQVTPVILTLNEIDNLGRTLSQLDWARQIVVVDSKSNDGTLELLRSNPRVKLVERPFESHADQWNYAVHETGIETEWVLALDADYVLTPELVAELSALAPPDDVAGYSARFQYCSLGVPLRGSVYPPVVVLYRRARGRYRQDGHTQRVEVEGATRMLSAPIRHDDRKDIRRWLWAQDRYMQLEARKLLSTPLSRLSLSDKIRRMLVIAPFAVFLYALFVRGAILDGRPGLFYALQRTTAEIILSLHLIKRLVDR